MLDKKDNLIIFVLCLIVISLGVLIMLKNSADVGNEKINIDKNSNVSIDKNVNIDINNNVDQNTNINEPVATTTDKNQTPENFVKEFYDYYFGPHYPGGISGFEFIKNNYLSDSFLKKMEGDKPRSYYLTCAQENPISTREYENIITTKNTSLVLASHLYYRDKQILVELKFKNNQWKIDDIQCLPMQSEYRTPKNIAKEFYNCYLGGYQKKFIDFKYIKDSDFLTDSFLKKIEDGEYNPSLLLCSQEVPISSKFDKAKITGNTASVLAHHLYSNDKQVLAELKFKLKDGEWKIDDIQCLK
ncbi:DUF3828 domain-containing protein [Candidatus Parcubacteria bacterium]|nr:DUF3828 domain-containing protein [Candidatus Parcubacteria bacterium]